MIKAPVIVPKLLSCLGFASQVTGVTISYHAVKGSYNIVCYSIQYTIFYYIMQNCTIRFKNPGCMAPTVSDVSEVKAGCAVGPAFLQGGSFFKWWFLIWGFRA